MLLASGYATLYTSTETSSAFACSLGPWRFCRARLAAAIDHSGLGFRPDQPRDIARGRARLLSGFLGVSKSRLAWVTTAVKRRTMAIT